MSPRPSLFAGREQALSGFAAPLGRLCEALSARAAAIVDRDGETVDFAGIADIYATKVAAAELQLVMQAVTSAPHLGASPLQRVIVRAQSSTLAAVSMGSGYTLIVHLPRRSFMLSQRALSQAVRELCMEGGFSVPGEYRREQWFQVRIEDDNSPARRPVSIWMDDAWHPVDVFGRVLNGDLAAGEVAYRVHLANGEEATIVREAMGRWYSETCLRI
jgi:predicted regulator of Ras-like GTPase activity (Roadblock/LC7/MglB family)